MSAVEELEEETLSPEQIAEALRVQHEAVKSGLSNISRASNGKDYAYVTLSLVSKNLATLDGVDGFQEIKYLDARGNQLTEASEVAALKNLLTCNLQSNLLTAFDGLTSPSLQLLQLDNNQITALAPATFPSLRALTLSNNQVTSEFGDLKTNFPSLKVVDFNNNKLTSLTGLGALPNLTALNVDGNKITSLDGVQECKSLQKLLINDNQLSLGELSKLQSLSNLRVLGIARNGPLYEENPEENDVIIETLILLPKLDRLNGRDIDLQTRLLADSINKQRIADAEAAKADAEAADNEGDADGADAGSDEEEDD